MGPKNKPGSVNPGSLKPEDCFAEYFSNGGGGPHNSSSSASDQKVRIPASPKRTVAAPLKISKIKGHLSKLLLPGGSSAGRRGSLTMSQQESQFYPDTHNYEGEECGSLLDLAMYE